MRFEWDQRKAKDNLRKHGISFEEARTVFDDPRVVVVADLVHSGGEDRFWAIGRSTATRTLLVCHCLLCSKGNEIRVETLWMRQAMCDEKFDMKNCVVVDAPWTKEIGREVLLKLSHRVIEYFGEIGGGLSLPPERIMEIYLRHIADTGFKIPIHMPAADDETETTAVGNSL